MHSLPPKARIFVAMIWLLGILAFISMSVFPSPGASAKAWEIGLFAMLGVLSGGTKIRLMRYSGDKEVGSMSLGFPIIFATLLHCGLSAAVLVGALSTLSSCVFPRRQPLYQLAFNVALNSFETCLTGRAFLFINGGTPDLEVLRSFPAVMISCLLFFLLNTGAVAIAIALSTHQNVPRLWKDTFFWTAPSYFAGACAGTLAVMILGQHIGAVLLFVGPVAFLTYQSYALYTARDKEKQERLEEKQQHIEELQVGKAQLADLYLATIESLALAIDAKDPFTHRHILRVQRCAVATAQQMGIRGAELEGINTGAVLHDIGKLGVPDYVLLKPGRLTKEEFDKIKKHPEIGAAILDPVMFPWPVVPAVKYHHEHWDGTGYPEGLRAEAIPLPGRILAVADVYDALTSSRSYRRAWTHEQAIETIKQGAGTHFDPMVVETFLKVIDDLVQEAVPEEHAPVEFPYFAPRLVTSKSEQAARDIQRASAELLALYEVSQTMSSSVGLQETLDILARKLEAIFPGATCLFLLEEEGGDVLKARAVVGVNKEFFEECRTLGPDSKSLRVARDRQNYLGDYDSDDLLLTSEPRTQWVDLQTALITPIVHQGQVLGTINVYHAQPNAYSVQDQQLLELIAKRAAMALYNGLLFDRTRSSALTDPLTGLYNTRYLAQHIDDRFQKLPRGEIRRRSDSFAVLCLDLDSFKPINDLFGHQKGDQVLYEISQVFRASLREDDVLVRCGGDEFLIILDDVSPVEAEAIAANVQDAVTGYAPGLFHPTLGGIRVGVSIGLSCFPRDGSDWATLLSIADSRMYQQKAERKLGQLAGEVQTHQQA